LLLPLLLATFYPIPHSSTMYFRIPIPKNSGLVRSSPPSSVFLFTQRMPMGDARQDSFLFFFFFLPQKFFFVFTSHQVSINFLRSILFSYVAPLFSDRTTRYRPVNLTSTLQTLPSSLFSPFIFLPCVRAYNAFTDARDTPFHRTVFMRLDFPFHLSSFFDPRMFH